MEISLTEVMTKGGPTALVAGLFIYIVTIILNKFDELHKTHREDMRLQRQEHISQVKEITDKFTNELREFNGSLNTMNESMRNLSGEVHEIKLKVNITNVSSG